MITELNATNFIQSIEQEPEKLQVVFVYGNGCGPCALTKPKYEMVANYFERLGAGINFYKFDSWAQENREFSKEKLQFKVVPSFIAYYKGNEMWRFSGMLEAPQQKAAMLSMIDTIYQNYGVRI